MKRRDFVKVTAKGSLAVMASPALVELVLGEKAQSGTGVLAQFAGLENGLTRVLSAALAGGGQFADVYLEQALRTGINLVDGNIDTVDYGVHVGGGVRVISDLKTGYAYCDSWEEESLARVARVASEISRGQGSAPVAVLAESAPRGIVRYSVSPDEVDAGRKVEVLELADRAARGYDPAIKQVTVNYQDEIRQILVANSRGVLVKQEIPLVWITVTTLAERGDKRASGYLRKSRKAGFEFFDKAFVRDVAVEAARQAVVMLDAVDAPSGEFPVIIGSGGGVVFHEAVGHGLEADAVERKTSFYAGLLGTRVGSEQVTLIEDPTIPNERGSYDFDDEGTPSSRTMLVENGVLKGYIYDLLSAWKLDAAPTGNGRRQSYMYYPMVRMSNTVLLPGTMAAEEIVQATQRGILTRHLGGGEVDTATGNFTFGVREAYLVENGKATVPVRGATLIGNGPEIMKRIDMVASDLSFWPGVCGKGQWVPVSSGAPTLRIASINVGGRG